MSKFCKSDSVLHLLQFDFDTFINELGKNSLLGINLNHLHYTYAIVPLFINTFSFILKFSNTFVKHI